VFFDILLLVAQFLNKVTAIAILFPDKIQLKEVLGIDICYYLTTFSIISKSSHKAGGCKNCPRQWFGHWRTCGLLHEIRWAVSHFRIYLTVSTQ
jgi:hypothetical protein